jgi:hypothetical protein
MKSKAAQIVAENPNISQYELRIRTGITLRSANNVIRFASEWLPEHHAKRQKNTDQQSPSTQKIPFIKIPVPAILPTVPVVPSKPLITTTEPNKIIPYSFKINAYYHNEQNLTLTETIPIFVKRGSKIAIPFDKVSVIDINGVLSIVANIDDIAESARRTF